MNPRGRNRSEIWFVLVSTGSLIFIKNCLDPEVAKQLSEATIGILNIHREMEIATEESWGRREEERREEEEREREGRGGGVDGVEGWRGR